MATEVVSAQIKYGFEQCKLAEILADVDPRNDRSVCLLEYLGFRETHREANTVTPGDEWCDSVYLTRAAPKS